VCLDVRVDVCVQGSGDFDVWLPNSLLLGLTSSIMASIWSHHASTVSTCNYTCTYPYVCTYTIIFVHAYTRPFSILLSLSLSFPPCCPQCHPCPPLGRTVPEGGELILGPEAQHAYETGNGSVLLRATAHIERDRGDGGSAGAASSARGKAAGKGRPGGAKRTEGEETTSSGSGKALVVFTEMPYQVCKVRQCRMKDVRAYMYAHTW
jgi:hypothetical protein